MQAMQLMGFGDLDQLQLTTVPRPQSQTGEVLIKVAACGLNNTDLNLRKGWYTQSEQGDNLTGWKQSGYPFPIIQGADVVGEIVDVGSEVDHTRIGQRVMVNPTIYLGDPQDTHHIDYLGSERPGGFAEYVCVPVQNAICIDSRLSDAELATFATSYLTAEHMLNRAQVQAGETVLITGASGGVGSALVQLVRARNANVLAVVGRGKEDLVYQLGANDTIIRGGADFDAVTARYTIDAVADVVGGAGFSQLIDVVRPGGRIVTCGAIAGPLVEIDLRTLYLRNLAVFGSTLGTASDFKSLVAYIEAGQIQPVLAQTYPLADLPAAQQAFDEKKFFGKIVIEVSSNENVQ